MVENGEWRPGDQIPTEDEMCEQYQVSKITVKQAIAQLAQEGLLYRHQGKGTFVCSPKIEQGPTQLASFSEQMRQRGQRPGGVLLSCEETPASKKVAAQLRIPAGTPVIQIKRLRLADDEPMGIQTSHIPLSRCPQLCAEDVGNGSLYELLDKHGLRPVSAVERYEAVLSVDDEARLLNVAPGAPVFLVERTAYDRSGVAIEYVRSVMRGDRYAVTVALSTRSE